MKTISGALAYDDQVTGKMTVLVVHQAIHMPTMESSLLCPMQVWMNDVKVDETPKLLTKNPTDIMHGISGKDGDGIHNRSLPSKHTSGGLMADVPCLDHQCNGARASLTVSTLHYTRIHLL